MLNPDFPFEDIACGPYLEEMIVPKNEVGNWKNVVKTEPATELEWVRYYNATFM
jgi:hypothetical protein